MLTKTNSNVIEEILKLHQQGVRDAEIASRLGTSKSNVQHHLEGNRVIRRRYKSDRTPLTEEILSRIRLLHTEGLRDKEIADILDIGKSTIAAFLSGKRTINHKPKQVHTEDGRIICSICKEPKDPQCFNSPKSNGRNKSKPSFCKSCQRDKNATRLSDITMYLCKRRNDLAARARKHNVPFNLTTEFIKRVYKEQEGRCFYTDVELHVGYGALKKRTLRQALSFDRIVPELGYIEGNVVLCTYKANAVKQDLTLDEVRVWLPNWYHRLQSCKWVSLGGRCDIE